MIVEPDFLNHWKTQMLTGELGDKAPLYVISLWAHCQQRKADRFCRLELSALKAICRYEGEANKLRAALERCGFLDVDGEYLIVHGWAAANAKLLANWENGQNGGRPAKTHRKPKRNPKSISANPTETDREEKIRGDGLDEKDLGVSPLKPHTSAPAYHELFELFWKTYPRRTRKRAAYAAWKSAGKRLMVERSIDKPAAVEVLQASCVEFASSAKGQGQFCPHPATWLNGSSYDDDRGEWQRKDTNGKPSTKPYGTSPASDVAKRPGI